MICKCIYCGAEFDELDDVPEVGDDEAWASEKQRHNDQCEWVLTRAHQREVEHGDD